MPNNNNDRSDIPLRLMRDRRLRVASCVAWLMLMASVATTTIAVYGGTGMQWFLAGASDGVTLTTFATLLIMTWHSLTRMHTRDHMAAQLASDLASELDKLGSDYEAVVEPADDGLVIVHKRHWLDRQRGRPC